MFSNTDSLLPTSQETYPKQKIFFPKWIIELVQFKLFLFFLKPKQMSQMCPGEGQSEN